MALAFLDTTQLRAKTVTASTVILELSIKGATMRKKMRTEEALKDADREMIHLGKDLIDQREMRDIRRADSRFRTWLEGRAVASGKILRGGMSLIPLSLFSEVDAAVQSFARDRESRIDAFLARYDALREEARARLGEYYEERDYPTAEALRAAFVVDCRWLAFDIPAALAEFSRERFEEEQAKIERQWADSFTDIRDALRVSFGKLVEKMVSRLAVDPTTGKPAVFRDTLVSNFEEFLSIFDNRNITGDQDLAELVGRARALLRGVTPDRLRLDDETRSRVRSGFEEVERSLDEMIVERDRQLSFEADV